MRTIWITCSKCGKVFDYNYRGSGKKPEYCEECRVERLKELQKSYVSKRKQLDDPKFNYIPINTIEQVPTKTQITALNSFVERGIILCEQLDKVRIDMCNFSKELRDYQSGYDKQDQDYLHKIEANGFTSAEEALEFVTAWHEDRKTRRDVKSVIAFMNEMIQAIPIKNKFAAIGVLKYGRSLSDTRRDALRTEEGE